MYMYNTACLAGTWKPLVPICTEEKTERAILMGLFQNIFYFIFKLDLVRFPINQNFRLEILETFRV